MRIIGVDCATKDAKTGLALAIRDENGLRLQEAITCSRDRPAISVIAAWLTESPEAALVAIDAPLGWPKPLGESLVAHRAGATIGVPANRMFRRSTDLFVKDELGKTPLDVGADRIARTAHAALILLERLRVQLGSPIPLAWDRTKVSGHAVIEVYLVFQPVPCRSCQIRGRHNGCAVVHQQQLGMQTR